MFILKVTYDNGVTEIVRSDLSGADFQNELPDVVTKG